MEIAYFTNSVKFICLIFASFRYQGSPQLATCCSLPERLLVIVALEHHFTSIMPTLNDFDNWCQPRSPIANFHQFLFPRLARSAINKSISSKSTCCGRGKIRQSSTLRQEIVKKKIHSHAHKLAEVPIEQDEIRSGE